MEEARDRAREVMEALKKEKAPPSMKLFTDKAEEHMIWEIRESGLGATANIPGEPLSWTGWEDSAVRPDKVGDYLRDFRKLLMKYHLDCALYGHFGQGCIHCRITFDLVTHGGIKGYLQFIDQASDLVVKYGGSFSGEHGDGQSRAVYVWPTLEVIITESPAHLRRRPTSPSRSTSATATRPGRIRSPCRRAGRSIFASTISRIRSPCPWAPIMPESSSRTCRSWCSTRAWTRARPKTP